MFIGVGVEKTKTLTEERNLPVSNRSVILKMTRGTPDILSFYTPPKVTHLPTNWSAWLFFLHSFFFTTCWPYVYVLRDFLQRTDCFVQRSPLNRLCELQLEITFWTELWRTLFRMNSISFFSSLGIITFSSQTYFHASVFIERGCRLLSELHFIDFLCCFQNILYREDVASSFLNFSVLLMIYAILRLYGERILFLRFHTINKC